LSITGSKSLFHADSVAASVGVVALATGTSRVLGLARGVALAWLIPQAQFGLFGIALLVVNVLLPLCSTGLYEGVARYTPRHEAGGTLGRFIIRSGLFATIAALAAAAVLWALADFVGPALFSTAGAASGQGLAEPVEGADAALMRASLICAVGLTAYHTLLGYLRGLQMFRAVATAELTVACVFTGMAVAAALYGHTSARALVITYAMSCAAVVLLLAPFLIRRAGGLAGQSVAVSPPPPRGLWTFSVWAAGTALLWHALAYYPMWYLLKVSDGQTVALFHAVRLVTQFVQVGAVVLTAVVAADINRRWEHQAREAIAPRLELLTKACLIVLLAGAAALSLARPIVMYVFPSRFAAGVSAYDPLVLFFWGVGVVGLVAIRLNVLERPRWVFCAWLVGAAVNVAAAYLFLGHPGGSATAPAQALPATAWAGVIGVSVALAVCAWSARREGLRLSRPAAALITAGISLGFGWLIALPVLCVVALLSLMTETVFTRAERGSLRSGLPWPRVR
jgi:O-antigen/teichoic acid export membrane protein